MTQPITLSPQRVENQESRHITLDFIRLGGRMDVTVVKRTIAKTYVNEYGVTEQETTEEQDVVRHYEMEELRRGDEFRDRRGYVLMTDAIAQGLAVSTGPMTSVSEFFGSTSPVSLIEFPENIGLTDEDLFVMKKPYDAVLGGLEFFVAQHGRGGTYYDLRDGMTLPVPIGCGPLNGFNEKNFDIDKADAILRDSPLTIYDHSGPSRQPSLSFGKNAKSSEVLFFDVILDKATYNKVMDRARYYRVRGVDSLSQNALVLFEMDMLGLRAGGAAKIDSVKDYHFHGRDEIDAERLVSPEY